jgi:hypothetical protein
MLTIDDGTFTVGNTFVDLLDADDYHELRLTEDWIDSEVTDSQKEAALVRAFDYLKVQDWASDAFTVEIPIKVIEAQCVAAGKELSSPGRLQSDVDSNVKRKRIEGAIETEYFSKNLVSQTVFTEIQNLIAPYLSSNQTTTVARKKTIVRM